MSCCESTFGLFSGVEGDVVDVADEDADLLLWLLAAAMMGEAGFRADACAEDALEMTREPSPREPSRSRSASIILDVVAGLPVNLTGEDSARSFAAKLTCELSSTADSDGSVRAGGDDEDGLLTLVRRFSGVVSGCADLVLL
jgi:hypothetical protein